MKLIIMKGLEKLLGIALLAGIGLIINCSSPKKIQQQEPPLSNGVEQPPAREPDQPKTRVVKTDSLLENLLKQSPALFSDILQKRDEWRVQIIYTQIDRSTDNEPVFRDYYFNVDNELYFYPASTVKFPIALLALQKLNELKLPGLNKYSTMITESATTRQTPVYNDPATPDGKPTIAGYVKKIFLVSDNDASNRLYEFLGQEYLNQKLHKMGYNQIQIIHRLNISLTEEENRRTNPVLFLNESGKTLYQQPMQESKLTYEPRRDYMGKGFMRNGKLVREPFNFSVRNRLPLEELHNILKATMFPQSVPLERRFNLNRDDFRFIWKYMSQYPAETRFPSYDTLAGWDAYCKFLYWGAEKRKLPKTFRIFNKVGDAYGFLIDVAYVVDFEKKIEFMASCVIHCNSDGIFNDDKYDYDSIGFPFMKNLGWILYEYELRREKQRIPDLSTFRLDYDK